ncbi:hypothetical protein G3I01_12765 [Gramella sp. MT6]|uniref:hypothetical protein n=1 Tax=Gramella sp. MT6 TaxID=2705471 RepID=UPI001C6016F9|nr:hypothetical protein [Gramella sp. MT6]QYA26341.1 hypothetical protein G3I01_12765 [Gramella sp. MT6]
MRNYLSLVLCFISSIGISQNLLKTEPVFKDFQELLKTRDFTVYENEAYFTLQSMNENISVIVRARRNNNEWNDRVIVDFSGKYKDLEPMLSPNGLKLFFVSNRPVSDSATKNKDFDIWYVERNKIDDEWSAPINLGKPINTKADEFYPSVTNSGNLYFTRPNPDNKSEDDIFYSQFINNSYADPTVLDDAINTKGYEFNSYIAPDESYLIFSGYNREDGLGSGDMYISTRSKDGKWSKAKNLGKGINSDQMDYSPFVDTTTGILYFTSRRSALEKEKDQDYSELINIINSYENGLSRIYRVDFSEFIEEE